VYYDLVSCLVTADFTNRSKSSWFGRLLDLFPGGYPHPRQLLALPREAVLDAKISARKHESLRALATWWLQQGERIAWGELSDEAARRSSRDWAGVGAWTREVMLLFTLGGPTSCPADDYGLSKPSLRRA
jgi:DNA-3-methyladenine glycosylase II